MLDGDASMRRGDGRVQVYGDGQWQWAGRGKEEEERVRRGDTRPSSSFTRQTRVAPFVWAHRLAAAPEKGLVHLV